MQLLNILYESSQTQNKCFECFFLSTIGVTTECYIEICTIVVDTIFIEYFKNLFCIKIKKDQLKCDCFIENVNV